MRRRQRQHHLQSGFALIALLALLLAGALYFAVAAFGPQAIEAERARKTQEALAQARDALIGYALQYRDQQAAMDPPVVDAMYGHLPLPDMGESVNRNGALGLPCATEGCAKMNNSGTTSTGTYIGRFPWRTLGIEPLRDGYGECLWYVVSATHKSIENPGTLNWDTVGQLDIVVADGADSLKSVIASPHARPIAIIVAPGSPLPGQARTPSIEAPQCGGNYGPANYLDASVTASLRDYAGAVTTSSSYFDGSAATDTSTAALAISAQGNTYKDTNGKLWDGACPAGNSCAVVANDRALAVTPDQFFGTLRKDASFRTDINSLLERIVSCLRDEIAAGGGPTGNSKIADDAGGCFSGLAVVPVGYYTNYKNQMFVARSATTVNGATCSGALLFANQRSSTQSRVTPAEQSDPAQYLEEPNLTAFTTGTNTFAGDILFNTLNSGQVPQQDIVRCIPSTPSIVTTPSPLLPPDQQLANYDPGTRVLTLGKPGVTTNDGYSGATLFGCAWTPEANAQGNGFRAYFTFQFNKVGTTVGNTGFTFAAIDADSNSGLPCGASGSHLGYSGDNGVAPPIAFPKIGIEFDQSRNAGFSESSGNPGREDPCGTSGCGGSAGFNSHAAIVYWGHETANAVDGVTLPNNDDNVHGFPATGSETSSVPPPQNPNNLGAASPGIAFVDMRSKASQGGNSYLYHVRVEITPSSPGDTLANVRVAVDSNVALTAPGTSLDGVTLATGNRVLLARQSARNEGGIYVWQGATTPMVRSGDADQPVEFTNAVVRVSEGSYANRNWWQSNTIGVVDTDAQNWQLLPVAARKFTTQAWIEPDPGITPPPPLIQAMQDTTRPMAQRYPGYAPRLSDTAMLHDIIGASCGAGCPSGQTCGVDNRCHRPPLQSVRLGFTASQWTQDEQVAIQNFFATWLQ